MGVNKVDLSNGETLIDLTSDTVTPETLAEGVTAHNSNGDPITGTMRNSGDTVEEVVYVDALFDFSTFSVVSVNKTYAEIVALIEAGKYIVARATYALVAAPVNVAYFPLSANAVEQNNLLFTGMINTALNGRNVLLSVSVFMFTDNSTNVRARVVSTTDLN